MSDLIKKIKIKKQDGTYTDYIPIGAEAKNVDCSDGESVEYKLNKKPYYYNSVADMKADTNLKVGDMVITLGYNTANDGDGAKYKIVNSSEKYYEELNNALKAELIINDAVNIRTLGIKSSSTEDQSAKFQEIIDNNQNIYIPNGEYIFKDIIIHSNLKIQGEDKEKTKIIVSDGKPVFKYDGGSKNKNVYKYTCIDSDESQKNYYITIDGEKYQTTIDDSLSTVAGTLLYFIPDDNICIYVDSEFFEKEFALLKISGNPEGTNVTSSATIKTVNTPLNYCENFECLNCYFTYNGNNNSAIAISIINGKNISIHDCNGYRIRLLNLNLSLSSIGGSTTVDNYIEYGLNTQILNHNIEIYNNFISGKPSIDYKLSRIDNQNSGVWLSYVQQARIHNNIFQYQYHGISMWGGNVGPGFLKKPNMLHFNNDIVVTDNIITCHKMGGFWTSRASENIVNNNKINVCGDVGIDFEGSSNCVAVGNVVNDCANGCLATLYNSYEILFSGNVCEDNEILNKNSFILAHAQVRNEPINIQFINNIFNAKTRLNKVGVQLGEHGVLTFKNNHCTNTMFNHEFGQQFPPTYIIENNVFIIEDKMKDALNGLGVINIVPSTIQRRTRTIIKNNFITCVNKNTSVTNNPNFNNSYGIRGYRGHWGFYLTMLIQDNIIHGFSKSICLAYVNQGTNNEYFLLNLIGNQITGDIVNESDDLARGIIYYENNKKYAGSYDTRLINYPNTLPNTTDGYAEGSVIYFNAPDANGYTQAKLYKINNTLVWKRMNKIEE